MAKKQKKPKAKPPCTNCGGLRGVVTGNGFDWCPVCEPAARKS